MKNGKETKVKKQPLLSPEQSRVALFMVIAAMLVLMLAVFLWRTIVATDNQARYEQALDSLVASQQQIAFNYQQSVLQQLRDYASNRDVKLLFNSKVPSSEISGTGIASVIFDWQRRIEASLPHNKKIQIFLPKQAQQEKNQGGTIGFVALDMINRAEQGIKVYPEVSKVKSSDDWEIHWVAPIYGLSAADVNQSAESVGRQKPVAILYAVTTTTGLAEAFANYDQRLGRLQVAQKIGRQRLLEVFSVGQAGIYEPKSTAVVESHWVLQIAPTKFFAKKVSVIPLWFVMTLIGLMVSFLSVAYYFADRKNRRQAALYQALNIKVGGTSAEKDAVESDGSQPEQLSDPIYLTDQQLEIDEEDQALIDGDHQVKQEASIENPGIAKELSGGKEGIAVASHIFRAYDIRGLVDKELTTDVALAVGKAIASEALEQGENAIVVGYDARTHSPLLCENLRQGILSTGCNVIDIGLVPTPLMNFAAVFSDQTSSGVIVTASHNPKEYNGFKAVINEKTLVDDDIQRLKKRINSGAFVKSGAPGTLNQEAFAEDYIDTIAADIAVNAEMHIVIDAANGAASELAPALFEELGCKVTPLYCEFDGEFPHHDPDPSVLSNLQALIEKVQSVEADLGIALDGDGDRLVAVTSSGKVLWPDQLLMLFSRDVVSRNPGCDVIFDIKSTRQLNQIISSYGGRPIMWKTGHSHIKAKMKETGALLAGEFSGHIFFKERWFGFDDGMYSAARLMEIMSLRDQSLDDMLSSLPDLSSTPEIKVVVSEEEKFSLIEKLIEVGDFASGEKTTIDGLRVDFAKGWGLIRASNTAPALTLRFEADSDSGVEQLKTLFKRELQKVDSTLSLDF
ncbi:MAG: phosphomannomutase/phosphoglucomutase [Cellvibrionaceae bacterium]